MAAEVLRPGAHVRPLCSCAQPLADAAAHLGPERTSEIAGGIRTGVFTQPLEQKKREVHARLPLVVAQLTAAQIVDDGAGRVETRGHGQNLAGKWQYRGRVAQAVKSRASGQPAPRSLPVALLLLLAPTWGPADARAESARSQVARGQLPAPPAFTGAASASGAPQTDPPLHRRCSLTRPVCVETAEPELLPPAVRLLSDAYEVGVLGNQGPAWGLDRLGEPILWRLGDAELSFEAKEQLSLGFARSRPLCRGGSVTRASALACVVGSALTRVAPATVAPLVRGAASYFATTWSGDAAEAQHATQPELGFVVPEADTAAARLLEHVAVKAERGRGTAAVWLSLSLAATSPALASATSPALGAQFNPEPDFFDVLRSTLGDRDRHLAHFFDELAVLRFSETGGAPASVALTPAWEVDGASLPRNLVLPRPLLPTGSTYLTVRLDAATRQAGLAVRTFCETGTRYVWSLARLGPNRVLQSRVPIVARDAAPNAEGAVVELDGTHEVLIVGTSLGGGPGEDFDPDLSPYSPRSCEVALDRLPQR